MLKKITLAILLILPMGVFAQTLKFGHVASQEIFVLMPEYTKAMEDLQALDKQLTEDLQHTNQEFQKKFEEYQKAMAEESLPQAIAERRQKEIQDMAQRQEQFQQEAYQTMEAKQRELMGPIYQKLDTAIKSVGQSEGMIYIFDLSRTSIPYINESMSTDVTAKVKTQLGLK